MAQIQACPALIRSVGVTRPSSKPCAVFDPPLLCSTALGGELLLGHPAGRPSESDKSNLWRIQRRQKPDRMTGSTTLSETGWHPAGMTFPLETFTKTWISFTLTSVSIWAEKLFSLLCLFSRRWKVNKLLNMETEELHHRRTEGNTHTHHHPRSHRLSSWPLWPRPIACLNPAGLSPVEPVVLWKLWCVMQHKHTTTCKRTPVQVECPVPPIQNHQQTHGRQTLKLKDNSKQKRRRLLSADRKSRLREELRTSTLEVLMRTRRGLYRIFTKNQTLLHTLLEPFHAVFRCILLFPITVSIIGSPEDFTALLNVFSTILLLHPIALYLVRKHSYKWKKRQIRAHTHLHDGLSLQYFCALTVCVHPSSLMCIHLKISSCLPFQSWAHSGGTQWLVNIAGWEVHRRIFFSNVTVCTHLSQPSVLLNLYLAVMRLFHQLKWTLFVRKTLLYDLN